MNHYLTFLQLKQTLVSKHKNISPDLKCEKLLQQIAIRFFQESALTVTQAMALESIASPATLHRKISELIEAGWIKIAFFGANKRTKYLVPTAQMNHHYRNLSKIMFKA